MARRNMFSGILSYENNVSSLIQNLAEYELFMKELLEFLELDVDYKDAEIYTEIDLRNKNKSFGRIDIMIFDSQDNEYLIESKIKNYRTLTKNQEDQNYVNYIEDSEKAKKLIFLLPKNYEHIETIDIMRNDNKGKIEIKYWQNFVKHFKQSSLYELNQFIKEFIDFLEDWFIPNEVKFSYDEIKTITLEKDVTMNDAKIATIMKKLIEIVDNINIKTQSRRSSDYYGGHGYKIDNSKYELSDELFVWYGIDYDAWEKHGYPLVIWIENDVDGIKEVLGNDEFQYFKHDEGEALVFLFKDFRNENILDEIEEKIVETIDKLKKIKNRKS